MQYDRPEEFTPDPLFERLIRLKNSDPAKYYGYPEEVRKLAERYEAERDAAARGKKPDEESE